MAVRLTPAVLASTSTELVKRLRLAQKFSRRVHLDIMDGRFVASRSVGRADFRRLPSVIGGELHIMAQQPLPWLRLAHQLSLRRVILHVELGRRLTTILHQASEQGLDVTFAINPNTPLNRLWPWIGAASRVVVMGVKPGRYGAPF